jgi:hypothetical protein
MYFRLKDQTDWKQENGKNVMTENINGEKDNLNNIIHQLDLTDICRILHTTRGEHVFSSSAYEHSPG